MSMHVIPPQPRHRRRPPRPALPAAPRPAPRLTALDVTCLQMVAAFFAGLLLCEIYALLTGAPHVTIILGW